MAQSTALDHAPQHLDPRPEDHLEIRPDVQQLIEGHKRVEGRREIGVPISNIGWTGLKCAQEPLAHSLGLASVLGEMANGKVLGIFLMQPFEHPPGPVGTPIIDEQEPYSRLRAGKCFKFGDLKPCRLVVTGNDNNGWRPHTAFLLIDTEKGLLFACYGNPYFRSSTAAPVRSKMIYASVSRTQRYCALR